MVGSAAYSIDRDSTVIGYRPAAPRQRLGFSARHSFHHPTVAGPISWFRRIPILECPVLQPRRGRGAAGPYHPLHDFHFSARAAAVLSGDRRYGVRQLSWL